MAMERSPVRDSLGRWILLGLAFMLIIAPPALQPTWRGLAFTILLVWLYQFSFREANPDGN